MPRDQDEDLSPPIPRGPARPAAPRPAPQPAASPDLAWGVCGVVNQPGDLIAFPGSAGVIRYVTSGVTYTPPPIRAPWRASDAEPGRVEMVWDGPPANARTLLTLRRDLDRAARAGELTDPNHPLLQELDEVAAGLAALAGRVFAKRWGLGLLQPQNVVIRGNAGGREVVPVDLGFSWRGSFGPPPWDDSPGRPEWLDADGPNRWLWDHDPARQQFADPANGVYPPLEPVVDLRTVGRLLAWLLSGQMAATPPAIGGPNGPPPAWAVVSDAAAGRIDSADDLAERLRTSQLSSYFAPLEELPPERSKLRFLPHVVGGLITLTVIVVAVIYFAIVKGDAAAVSRGTLPTGTLPTHVTPKPPDPTPGGFDPAGFDKALAAADVNKMFAELMKLYGAAPSDKLSDVEKRRLKTVEEWKKSLATTVKQAGDPTQRIEAARRFEELQAQLKTLTDARPATDPNQQAEEKQCLDFAAEYVRLFGSPR